MHLEPISLSSPHQLDKEMRKNVHTLFFRSSSCFLSVSVLPTDPDLASLRESLSSLLARSSLRSSGTPDPDSSPSVGFTSSFFLLPFFFFFFSTRPSLTLLPFNLSFPPPPVAYSSGAIVGLMRKGGDSRLRAEWVHLPRLGWETSSSARLSRKNFNVVPGLWVLATSFLFLGGLIVLVFPYSLGLGVPLKPLMEEVIALEM